MNAGLELACALRAQVERHTESFLQEAATLQKVNHPNVLRFYGVVIDSDAAQSVVGIITEYLPDGSLSAYLRRALNTCTVPLTSRGLQHEL